MGAATKIAWTDHTFNPWWGCERVSPACNNCYAETFAKRTGNHVWGRNADRRFFGENHWNEPLGWDRKAAEAGRRELVFCASMADVFEDRDDLVEPRARLFDTIAATPNLVWLLLTKRPQHVLDMVPAGWHGAGYADRPDRLWPSNVWVGTTVEDQERAFTRIPHLLRVPAPVRFLSCEPLLAPVDLTHMDVNGRDGADGMYWINALTGRNTDMGRPCRDVRAVGWVICGGESGPRHRPLDLDAARSLRDQCAAAGVPYFFKQVGGRTPAAGGDSLDGEVSKVWPAQAGDRSWVEQAAAVTAETEP